MLSVEKDNKNKDKNKWLRLGMMMFAEATGWIAFPVIGALFLGRWLDEMQGTEPLYFFSITALAFIISSVGIGITGVKYMKRIDQAETKLKTLSQIQSESVGSEAEGKKEDKNESRDK